MPWDSVPWFIGGGAEHSPEVARVLAFAATSGAEGIVTPGDLKVAPLDVPGTKVRVGPGAGLIPNRSVGGTQQTYVGRLPTEDTVDVAATTSAGGRIDLVVARIEDPFMVGETWPTPGDVKVGPYIRSALISNVPASAIASPEAAVAYVASIGQSAIPLAGINLPASTGTVEATHIVSLRKLAQPRRDPRIFRHQPSQTYDIATDGWAPWPIWEPLFVVPNWATHVVAVMSGTGIYKPVGGNILGDFRLEFATPGNAGTVLGTVNFEEDDNSTPRRVATQVSGEGVITAHRGQTRTIRIGGRRSSQYSAANSKLQATPSSNFILTVQFEERTV